MSQTLSGKERAARVPLNYFSGSGGWRRTAAWIVFGVAAFLAVVAVASGYWKQMGSPGPVYSAHAPWENDCQTCHLEFRPTGSSNFLNVFSRQQGKVADELCIKCHNGPIHHAVQIESEVQSCASCHIDHRGRTVSISRTPDAICTNCHENLSAHLALADPKDPQTKAPLLYENTITKFEKNHPQFKLGPVGNRKELGTVKDPGRLRFNHRLHLAEGLQVKWTYKDITDKKLRDAYKELYANLQTKEFDNPTKASDVKDTDLMKLDCAACHRFDATDQLLGQGLPRASGDLLLPVTYEQHCRGCHPLTFSEKFPGVEVPHRLQPPQVEEYLGGLFLEKAGDPDIRKQLMITNWPLPGKNLTREEIKEQIKGAVAREGTGVLFEQDITRAKDFVLKGKAACGLCHYYDNPANPKKILPVTDPAWDVMAPGGGVWYSHAKFSHRPHRAVKCDNCHSGVEKSETEKDILLPGVENCRDCHSSARTVTITVDGKSMSVRKGGVRQDCATCHRYHDGDHPRAWRGAAARGVDKRLDWKDWLKGGRPQPSSK